MSPAGAQRLLDGVDQVGVIGQIRREQREHLTRRSGAFPVRGGPRTISVYSPSWRASWSARVGDRPVNAAIPQSPASGAAPVYQA
jgi:hypothetical protein